MKKLLVIPVIFALICGITLSGCTSDRETPEDDGIPESGLYVTGAASVSASSLKATTEPVFTGDDIVSFNLSDGEIIFSGNRMEAIMTGIERHSELYFYIGGKPVFDPAIRIHSGYGETFGDFDLQFRTVSPPVYEKVRVFLTGVYMNIDTLPEAERLIKKQEMEVNKAKREKELDALIKYLSAAGKIIDVKTDEPPIEEPEPEVTGIRIKDNPCETLRYIRKIGTDFDSALDSLRMFKNITSEVTKIPLEVIFDTDNRQFYGIEYGSGKYTDVLDTKGNWYERTYECTEEDNPNDDIDEDDSDVSLAECLLRDVEYSLCNSGREISSSSYIRFTAIDNKVLQLEQGFLFQSCTKNVAVNMLSEGNSLIIDVRDDFGYCSDICPSFVKYNIVNLQENTTCKFVFKYRGNVFYTMNIKFTADLNKTINLKP